MAALAEHDRTDRHAERPVFLEQLFRKDLRRAAVFVGHLCERFRTARRRVRGIVMDAEEQVGGVLIALHDLAAQRQITALLERIAHHDHVHTGALQIALQIFRNRKVDVLLVVYLVDARRADVAAAVTGVDDDRHPAVDLRGAGRLDRIVRLALGRGVVAHADEIVRADVAAGSLGGVHQVRPAVGKAVHDDLCVRGELTDLFRGRGRGSAHRELALDLYAVPAGRERLVWLGLAVIIAQTLEITRTDIAARARRGVHQMRPAVRKAVYDDLVALRQLADGRIGGSRAGAHGERGRNIHLVQTGRKNRFRRRGGRRRVRRRAAVVIIVAAVIVIRLLGVRVGRRELDGARGIVPSGLEADRVRDVRDAVIVVVVDQVAAEGDRAAVEQDLEGGRGDLERGEGRGGKLAADLLIFLTGDQIDDRALAGRPGDVEGRGGVAEKIRDVAQLEVVIAVNIIGLRRDSLAVYHELMVGNRDLGGSGCCAGERDAQHGAQSRSDFAKMHKNLRFRIQGKSERNVRSARNVKSNIQS